MTENGKRTFPSVRSGTNYKLESIKKRWRFRHHHKHERYNSRWYGRLF